MNETTLSKKKLFSWLLVIILLAVLGFGFSAVRRFLPSGEAAAQPIAEASLITPEGDQQTQAAARHGARMGSVA